MRGVAPFLVFAVVASVASGCGTCEPSSLTADAATEAVAHADPSPFPAGRPRTSSLPAHIPLSCRIATVTGTVTAAPLWQADGATKGTADAGPLTAGEVPSEGWLDLAASAHMVARDPVSTRETSFLGPARVRACVEHDGTSQPGRGPHEDEESWVLRGIFESAPGSGERPGGEEWVVTPMGVVRYDAAGLRVTASAGLTEARVDTGSAFVWPAADAAVKLDAGVEEGWLRVNNGATTTLRPAKAQSPAAAASKAASSCKAAADRAKDLAEEIAAPDASLGDLAPRHINARKVARAACAVALLRAQVLPGGPSRDDAMQIARAADAEWRSQTEAARPALEP